MSVPTFYRATTATADEAVVVDTSAGDVTLSKPSVGLYVGVAGDVKVDMAKTGTAITFPSMAGGIVHPLAVSKIYATTTATGLRAVN